MKRLLPPAAVMAVACVALSGCQVGGSDSGSTSSAGSSNAANKTVTIQGSEPGSLSPGRQLTAYDMMDVAYTALTSVDDKGAVSMAQADSVSSTDATHWTIKIKDGWTFHNGEPVTAQSYADAWNAGAYAPNAWENSGELANIVGFSDCQATSNPAKELKGVKVVDKLTLTVDLVAPDGQFPSELSQGQTAFYPIPKAGLADLKAYDKQPIGDGPFKFTAPHQENQDITLEAYSAYPGAKPKVGKLIWKMYTDPTTAYNDALAGNLDIAGVPTAKMSTAKRDFGDHVLANASAGISYLGLPLWDKRFQDVRVRQALSMAIDREAVNKAIYADMDKPATSFTPHTELGTPTNACGEACTFNPTKAKELLAEAGGFSGSLVITFPGGGGLDDLYNAYANQLHQNLGIDASAKATTDWAQFQQQRAKKEFTGPYFSRWGALYPSQQNTLRAVFTSQSGGGCENCSGGFTDPELDAKLKAADAEVDPNKAAAAYGDAQSVLAKNLPALPMFDETWVFVTSQRVTKAPSVQGTIDFSKVEVKD